ncbi:type II toxin-antitoxin system RelE/ParE family toxin [Neorhizobium sp. DT-125]|uniref:type II toxin-antitoxin system RelE/ParE family toxin n=1 Tax=Neorhizobium sp. DT-125 TaxID=3396163 RepID=UPI003F1DB8CD
MKVIFTRQARGDLRDIGRYLLEQNPGRALPYMESLRAACFELAHMPDAFEVLELSSHPGIRRRVFAPYLIFYRAENSEMRILRIIHGARDYLRFLNEEI